MMLPPLLLRTDASPTIGLGHAMRLLALAQAFTDRGGRVHVAFSELPPTVRQRFVAEGAMLHHIDAPPGGMDDAQATAELARTVNAHWVVIDGYHFAAEYRRTLKATGLSLLIMDDLAKEAFYDADIVVNPNVYARTLHYRAAPNTRLLPGPRYALLRREFLSLRNVPRSVSPVVRRVLVTFGGSDPTNATAVALKALRSMPLPSTTIDVVVGGANPRRDELQRLADNASNRIRLLHDVHDMSELVARADLALSAASTTALELALAGVPSVLCATVDNQEAALHAFRAQNVALSIGPARSLSVDTIQTAVTQLIDDTELRRTLATRAQTLVDGNGARRVLQAMFPHVTFPEEQDN